MSGTEAIPPAHVIREARAAMSEEYAAYARTYQRHPTMNALRLGLAALDELEAQQGKGAEPAQDTGSADEALTFATGRLSTAIRALEYDGHPETAEGVREVLDQLTGWCSPRMRIATAQAEPVQQETQEPGT